MGTTDCPKNEVVKQLKFGFASNDKAEGISIIEIHIFFTIKSNVKLLISQIGLTCFVRIGQYMCHVSFL